MRRYRVFAASLAMLGSLSLLSIPKPVQGQTVNDFAQACLFQPNDGACGALGNACGQGNVAACNALAQITILGGNQIQKYCSAGRSNACLFLNTVNQLGGPRNLGLPCRQGNSNACSALSIIRCYATEAATHRACVPRIF